MYELPPEIPINLTLFLLKATSTLTCSIERIAKNDAGEKTKECFTFHELNLQNHVSHKLQFVHEKDPSQHLESIHNFYDPPQHKDTTKNWYDHTKPWITHVSVQSDNVFLIPKWIEEYQKPVVDDECRYEGNLEFGWGDNSAQGMMDNFWRVILRGGGCTHGETYIDKPDTDRPIWWAHGGKLYGKS